MARNFICATFAVALLATASQAQDLSLLKTDGWGSLSGKVTLDGTAPKNTDLADKMKIHSDKQCCLDPKALPNDKVDLVWIVDEKTKAVANVCVWIKAPAKTFFPTHASFKAQKDTITIDQPFCAFRPRVSAFNPYRYDEAGKQIESGQTLIIKNSAPVTHNVRAVGHPKYNEGFNRNLPGKTELNASKDLPDNQKLQPQPLPVSIQCDVHTWMSAKLFVFDHPYYAITKEDGTYEIPFVPAGAEISIMAYHEGVGWLLTKDGEKKTLKAGKNTYDFSFKAPAP